MGFLDKVKATAKDAKDALDKSGITEKVKEQVKSATSSGTNDQAPAGPVEPTTTASLCAKFNLLDPSRLLGTHEVATLTGVAVGEPTDTYSDTDFGVAWRGRAGRNEYSFSLTSVAWDAELGKQRTVDDAIATVNDVRSYYEATDLTGIGDTGFISNDGDVAVVRKGPHVFMLTASAPADYDMGGALTNLARTAMERVQG